MKKTAALLLVMGVLSVASASSQGPPPIQKSPPDATAPEIPGVVAGGTKVQLIIPIPLPPQAPAFAGPDKKTLYVVGRGAVYKVAMLAQGVMGRAK